MDPIEVEYMNGETAKVAVKQLNVEQRNDLFEEYFDLDKLMNSKDNATDDNILGFIREGKSVLKFMTETNKLAMPSLKINNVGPQENDRLFQEIIQFALGLGDKKN